MEHPDTLSRLEAWYVRQCDGEWEHTYGIHVDTLDNPGWTVRIDLTDTDLTEKAFELVTTERTDEDWLVCRIEQGQFTIACGPRNLGEALTVFLDWAD